MEDAALRSSLRLLSPQARDELRSLLIGDQAGRDAIAEQLLRRHTSGASQLAELIDMLSLVGESRQDWQLLSAKSGHPIRVWVIEGNSAFKHLVQYQHFRVWQRRWPMASVILHQTQRNKTDETMGVEALLPGIYKQGLARIPHRHGDLEALNFVRAFRRELTQYPESSSSDLVMAHWMAEWNLSRIVRAGRRGEGSTIVDAKLPPYLRKRLHEIPLGPEKALA